MNEAQVQSEIWRIIGSRPDTRLWRNNVGVLRDASGRPVRYGLANPGGSDLIGLHKLVVTPEMVGRAVAVFTALEVKTEAGKVSPEQEQFIEFVRSFGGIAGVTRSALDATRLIESGR